MNIFNIMRGKFEVSCSTLSYRTGKLFDCSSPLEKSSMLFFIVMIVQDPVMYNVYFALSEKVTFNVILGLFFVVITINIDVGVFFDLDDKSESFSAECGGKPSHP